VQFGPNVYQITAHADRWERRELHYKGGIPLLTFLDFAVGATECLEILHHGHELVHGEIRGDAFHFAEDGMVKMINFGSGARSFENGLTSAGCMYKIGDLSLQSSQEPVEMLPGCGLDTGFSRNVKSDPDHMPWPRHPRSYPPFESCTDFCVNYRERSEQRTGG